MIHSYTLQGYNVVIDTNSGAVHLLDDACFALLGYIEPPLAESLPRAALDALASRFGADELAGAYAELRALWREGALYSTDDGQALAARLTPSPVKAMCLNVSHDCNLRCAYCFAGKGDYNGGRKNMDVNTGKRAVDYLIAHSGDRQRLEIDFFGGEPLLAWDTVRAVVRYARALEGETGKRFRFTITTNGMLLDDEKIRYINDEMANVVLSLDGRREVTDRVRTRVDGSGCWDAVVPRFQKLVQSRGDREYYVRGTFTRYNLDFTGDVLGLRDLGFDQVSVEPVVAAESEPYALRGEDLPAIFDEYEKLIDLLLDARRRGKPVNFFHYMLDLEQGPCAIKRLRGCGCGNEYVAVTPDGDVYPCHQFIGREDWRMGSVHDNSLDGDKKAYFAATSVLSKPDCKECWAKFYCSGGCNANNLQYAGDVQRAHALSCELEKKRLECAIVLKAKLLDV